MCVKGTLPLVLGFFGWILELFCQSAICYFSLYRIQRQGYSENIILTILYFYQYIPTIFSVGENPTAIHPLFIVSDVIFVVILKVMSLPSFDQLTRQLHPLLLQSWKQDFEKSQSLSSVIVVTYKISRRKFAIKLYNNNNSSNNNNNDNNNKKKNNDLF